MPDRACVRLFVCFGKSIVPNVEQQVKADGLSLRERLLLKVRVERYGDMRLGRLRGHKIEVVDPPRAERSPHFY